MRALPKIHSIPSLPSGSRHTHPSPGQPFSGCAADHWFLTTGSSRLRELTKNTGNIRNTADGASLIIIDSTFCNNESEGSGSAINETDRPVNLVNNIIIGNNVAGSIAVDINNLYDSNATVAGTFAEVDNDGKAVLNEDGTFHILSDGAAAGTGVYVWHNEDYSSIAYSESYSGSKTAVVGNIADATILSTDQLGAERSPVSTDIGAKLASSLPVIPEVKTSSDLNGDGRADIVMTVEQNAHGAYGATGAWLIQADQTAAWGDLTTRNSLWTIFGMGFTAAGKNTADVYAKSIDNVIGAWTTGDDGKVNGWETIGEFSSDTQVVGLGDFNGNGQTDLLLRNVNGAVGCFFTGGEKTGWNYFQSLGDEWKLSAIGDLNGDGRDDVVLKHDAGFAGSWLTQADGTMAWADLDTLPDGYEIVGAGDFNGDGTDDVLLQKGNYFGAWQVYNGNARAWIGLGDLGDITVEQIADFNGDGKDDLRIRTSAGDLGTQMVMGEDNLVWKYYGSVGSEWSTALAALS